MPHSYCCCYQNAVEIQS